MEYSLYKKWSFPLRDSFHSFLRIWSHLLEKSLMETSFFFVQCFCCIIQKWNQRKLLKNTVILTRCVMLIMDTYIAIVKKHNICLVFIGNTFFCLTQHLSDFAITDPLFNFTHLFAEGDCKGGIFELYDRYDQYFCK